MLQKKVCMLGSFAVGKTSLVSQFVFSVFSDRYLSTIGVKIHRKVIPRSAGDVKLVLWDLHGEDDFHQLRETYLRGMAGYLLVADGTRSETLTKALELHERVVHLADDVPFCLLVNKHDLLDEWSLDRTAVETLRERGWQTYFTSAKSGENVERAFRALTDAMLTA